MPNDEHQTELIQAALAAKRQDNDALTLYWEYIRSTTESEVLPEAYRLLFTAWNTQNKLESLQALVESACQRHFSDIATLTLMANSEFQAQRDANALKLYDRLLTLNAMEPETYHNLKIACFRHQPFTDFVNLLLQQCLTSCPDDPAIVRFLSAQYLLHDKYTFTPFAPQIYRKMLVLEPDNLPIRSVLSESLYRQGKSEDAIAEGEQGLHYDHDHLDILATLAKAHYQRGEFGKVVTYCHHILDKRPGRADVQVLLAEVYAKNALATNDAIKTYKFALHHQPDHLAVRQALLRSYLRKLMADEAATECETLLNLLHDRYEPSAQEFRTLVKEIIEEYDRAIRRSPEDLTLYLITAKLHEEIGHDHQALMYYRTLLQFPLTTDLVARIIELLEKLTVFQTQTPHIYLYLGFLYHQAHRYEDAKAAFQVAMYSDLDEQDVEDILIRHEQELWRYPPVLVMLAHHRVITEDILEGLIQILQQPDREAWDGVLWVLQELAGLDDLIESLHHVVTWDNFSEIAPQIIEIFAQNGSHLAMEMLAELLLHDREQIRLSALHALFGMENPFAAQGIHEASGANPHIDIRLEILRHYEEQHSDQTTYYLTNMLRDAHRDVRLCAIRALQQRDVAPEHLREALFIEQDPEIKNELIKFFAQAKYADEAVYLAHLFNDLVSKRHSEPNQTGRAKVYTKFKKFIKSSDNTDEIKVLSTLIQALGTMRMEQGIYGLIIVASSDQSQLLRIEAIEALGKIGASVGMSTLQTILHTPSESRDIRTAAEQALEQILAVNPTP
jgi:tetratricopeptide (TPR) repeat protein